MTTLPLEGLIVNEPGLRSGRPIIAGTGVAVRTIVGHYKLGLTAEEIADEMNLALAGVYAALTYYHLNQSEIEADIMANSEAVVLDELSDGRADSTVFSARHSQRGENASFLS